MVRHQLSGDRRLPLLAARPSQRHQRGSRARSRSASMSRSMSPSITSEITPVSSDTTIATASFSSVTPIAARCRDPSSRLSVG